VTWHVVTLLTKRKEKGGSKRPKSAKSREGGEVQRTGFPRKNKKRGKARKFPR